MHHLKNVGIMSLGALCTMLSPNVAVADGVESSASQSEEDFQKELLTIEEKVTALKKNVFSAKATLNLLRELVVQENVSGSKVNVWQINQLNGSYVIKSAAYVLDGTPVYNINDSSGMRAGNPEIMVYSGDMGVDDHTLMVELELAGSGRGLFSYVDDYVFTVRSTTSFSSEEGENCVIRTMVEKRSALTYTYEERPNIVFQQICSEFAE